MTEQSSQYRTVGEWANALVGTRHKRLMAVLGHMRKDLLVRRVRSGVWAAVTPDTNRVVGHIYMGDNPRFEPKVPVTKLRSRRTVRQWIALCDARKPDWDELSEDLKLLNPNSIVMPDGPSVFAVAQSSIDSRGKVQVGPVVGYIDFLRPRFTLAKVQTSEE